MEILRRRALILDYLCTKSKDSAASITEIYKHFKVQHDIKEDRKTFERDIIKLSIDNRIIEVNHDNKTTRYFAVREKKTPLLNFKVGIDEIFTLVTAISTFKQTAPQFFSKSCEKILIDLGKSLKDEDQESFKLIRSITTATQGIDGQSQAVSNPEFEKLMKAIINRNCFKCQIAYFLNEKKTPETKHYMPLSFYFSNNTPYLYVYDLVKKENRLLRATRLINIEVMDRQADPKKVQATTSELGPHFSGYGSKNLFKYQITCDQAFATFFLERPFAKPYELTPIKDNLYRLSFELNDNDQLVRLLAG